MFTTIYNPFSILIQPQHRGSFLLEYVCEQLDITDKDYFGLRYVDSTKQRVNKLTK